MSKRQFRSAPFAKPADYPDNYPDYPTLEEFDRTSRRSFLTRLCGAALGAGALAALAGCGGRVVGNTPDTGKRLDGGPDPQPDGYFGPTGAAPAPDAGIDKGKPVQPDGRIGPNSGGAPQPDAQIDKGKPDAAIGPAGEAPQPDAQIDRPDLEATLGKQRLPDARCDDSGCPLP